MPSVTGSVIAAGLGAAGSIGGALIGQGSQDNALQAQEAATAKIVAEQQRQFDLTRGDLAPWRTTGGSALGQLASLYGLSTVGPDGKTVPGSAPDMSKFFTSPDYQFRMKQGLAGVDAGAAAGGSLDSGATRKAEIGYAGNLASGEFGNYANRLAGIAGVGQTAVNTGAQLGQENTNQISQAYANMGNAQSSYYLGQGNMYANALGGLANIGSGLITNNPNWFGSGSGGTGWSGGPW
jgi:hypothetical protein